MPSPGDPEPPAVLSTGSAGGEGPGFKDRDPPPTYDGENPELTFRMYEKAVKLWQFETDVPIRKQGAKMLRALTGAAKLAAEDLDFDEIAQENGVKNVLNKLREFFSPHLEVSLPRAFETAVYGQPRAAKESFIEYVTRVDRAFLYLEKEGVSLPEGAQGYIMYRQASLTEAQEQRVQTWTEGKYDRKSIVTSLRKLDKVIKEKGKGHFYEEQSDGAGQIFASEEAENYEDSDEEHIYINEGDLNEVYDEAEMVAALASYKEVRQALKEKRVSRGFYPNAWNRDKGSGKGFAGGKKGGSTARKIHIEQLKLRTRCNRCQQIGHWEKECQNPRVERGQAGSSSSSAGASRFGSSTKSGFFVISAEEKKTSAENFWLRQFVQERRKCSPSEASDENPHSDYKVRFEPWDSGSMKSSEIPELSFCGLTTQPSVGIVDTAAESGLVGEAALRRLEEKLFEQGLKCKWTPKKSSAKGVGGIAKSLGVVLIPMGIGGMNGVLECTVVQDEVPLLLPVCMLSALKVILNFETYVMTISSENICIPMKPLPSGHVTIQVDHFAEGPFSVPSEVGRLEDFTLEDEKCNYHFESAMVAQSELESTQTQFVSCDRNFPSCSHGAAVRPCEAAGQSICQAASGPSGTDGYQIEKPQGGFEELEGDHGQGHDHHVPCRAPRRHLRVVSTFATGVAFLQAFGGNSGGSLRGDHQDCQSPSTFEEQGCSLDLGKFLHPPSWEVERWGKRECFLHRVPRLFDQVGKPVSSNRDPQASQRREEGESWGVLESNGGEPCTDSAGDGSGVSGDDADGGVQQRGREVCSADASDEKRVRGSDAGLRNGDGSGAECGVQSGCGKDAAVWARMEAVDERGSRERSEAGCNVPGSVEQGECCSRKSSADEAGTFAAVNTGYQSGAKQAGSMSLQSAGGDVDGEEGGTPQGEKVLEVCPEALPVLRVGANVVGSSSEAASQSNTNPHRELECDGGSKHPSGRDRRLGELCCARTEKQRRWLRKAQANSRGLLPGHHFVADLKYQVRGADGNMECKQKYVPIRETREVEACVWMSKRTQFEDLFGVEKVSYLTGKQRREAFRKFEEMRAGKVDEVFSPPRVSEMAGKKGFQQGTSFDLETGWDLLERGDEEGMWRMLEEDDPILVVVCPPCKAFSLLQNLNYPKMEMKKAVKLLWTGLQTLDVALRVIEWQKARGKFYVFEHPAGAYSWQEPGLKALEDEDFKTVCDQCEYGLNVDGTGRNRKPTGILTNSEKISLRMKKKCQGDHHHTPTLSGLPLKAQVYPRRFCEAILQGLREELEVQDTVQVHGENWPCEVFVGEEDGEGDLEDALDRDVEAAGGGVPSVLDPRSGEEPGECQITEKEKRAVEKLHRSVGHPNKAEMIRFMRAARVRGDIIRWVQKKFRCDLCESKMQPKLARPTAIPRSYQPNRVLGIDLIYIPAIGGNGTLPCVSMVDWGTNYHMVELIHSKSPAEVWQVVTHLWFRTFGHPEVIITDPGREFLAEFVKQASVSGIITYQTAARAPWQQGKTERHGGHFKQMLDKARAEVVLGDEADLRMLMMEVEQAKNRFSNRSGFAPVQRQIGQWPRIPNLILSDEALDPSLVAGMATDAIGKLHEMRRIAQKAFVENNAKETVTRALKSRSRCLPEVKAGDLVYIYRVPKSRKMKGGEKEKMEIATNRATWVGPGTVLMLDGASLWVSMLGELWRVAREQCRLATVDEKLGVEAVLQECQELVQEYQRNPNRAGYKDLTKEDFPPEGEEEGDEEWKREAEPMAKRVKFSPEQDMEEELYTPTTPAEDPGPEVGVRRISVEEPETEVVPSGVGSSSQASARTGNMEQENSEDSMSRTEEGSDVLEEMRRSVQANNRLDGVPAVQAETATSSFAPVRNSGENRSVPYLLQEIFGESEDEKEEREEEADREKLTMLMQEAERGRKKDFWEIDWKERTVVRHHVKKRKAHYDPVGMQGLPFRPTELQSMRKTEMFFTREDRSYVVEDKWANATEKKEGQWWKGTTTFYLREDSQAVSDPNTTSVFVVEKNKGQDTADPKKEDAEGQRLWREADKAEWEKVVNSGAVKVLSMEESKKIRQQLAAENRLDRILPTKMVRRYKPAELVGQPSIRKSRVCLRGDKDPDILNLERFSPTVNTLNFNILLQVAANRKMAAAVADFSNAFCQSKPLERANGALYFSPPPDGIEGVPAEQVVVIVNGMYGLVDSPLHWRKSLVEDLNKLGYYESKLDPCIFKWHHAKSGELLGAIAVEVDDLFMIGGQEHFLQMQKLREKYKFGKWVELMKEKEGCSFNGRRVRQEADYGFQIDMQKFVEERLPTIEISKGRAASKKEDATPEEVHQARAVCGALNWLSKEGRPDAAGPSSLMASRLTKLKVEDLYHINDVVKMLKSQSKMAVKIQPLRNMKLGVVTDASYANDGFHSQGGHIVLAHEAELKDGQAVRANVLTWRSGKLQRVVNSTLAAETQSLSRGLADLMWSMVTFEEFVNGHFVLRKWPQHLSAAETLVLASSQSEQVLKQALAIVDAKSLYDHLAKDSVGGQDKRTAIEIQIIREDLNNLSGSIRWVDHQAMIADGLTKIKGSNESLYRLLESGSFCIQKELENLENRKKAREAGATNSEMRRSGIKENFGYDEISTSNMCCDS